jgi:hypothetical protein
MDIKKIDQILESADESLIFSLSTKTDDELMMLMERLYKEKSLYSRLNKYSSEVDKTLSVVDAYLTRRMLSEHPEDPYYKGGTTIG